MPPKSNKQPKKSIKTNQQKSSSINPKMYESDDDKWINDTDDYVRPPDPIKKECLLPNGPIAHHQSTQDDDFDEILKLISDFERQEQLEKDRIERERERERHLKKEQEKKAHEEHLEKMRIQKQKREEECKSLLTKITNLKTFEKNDIEVQDFCQYMISKINNYIDGNNNCEIDHHNEENILKILKTIRITSDESKLCSKLLSIL